MNNLKDIHNYTPFEHYDIVLFYQDFNEQFEGYTQPLISVKPIPNRCFIRISMNNLKDIHNRTRKAFACVLVVLSGFQ